MEDLSRGVDVPVGLVGAGVSELVIRSKVSGDSQDRFTVEADGSMSWGPGSGASDVSLERSGAGVLTLTGALAVSGLTASRLMASDGSKTLASVSTLSSWVAGTGNQVTVTDDGDGSVTLSLPQSIHTGASPTFAGVTASSLTASRLLSSDGLKALASVAALSSWIGGTSNQLTVVDDGDGSVTLSLPQNIHTGASPAFAGLTLSGMTAGSLLFAGSSGVVSQSNANLSWDNTNKAVLFTTARLFDRGINSVFLGAGAGNFTFTGSGYNVGLGNAALAGLTTGFQNVGIGNSAGAAITSGSENIAIGDEAMKLSLTSSSSVCIGPSAGRTGTALVNVVCIGGLAGYSNTTGQETVAIGYQSAYLNTTGDYNVAVGANALTTNTTGNRNVSVGYSSLFSQTTASYNVAVGDIAGYYVTTGYQNVFVGKDAGLTATQANATTTGRDCVYIGYQAGSGVSSQIDNAIAIGSGSLATVSNEIVFGNGAHLVIRPMVTDTTSLGSASVRWHGLHMDGNPGFNIYNAYTSSTSYEALQGYFSANIAYLVSAKGSGGGTIRNLRVGTRDVAALQFMTNDAVRWEFNNGTYRPFADNTYDLGDSTHQIKDAYVKGTLYVGTYSALAGEALAGYITMKDSAGNTRKVAVVA